MDIGFMGMGKLGLPCALTLEHYGQHQVSGYDVSDLPAKILAGGASPPREDGIEQLLATSQIKMANSVAEVVASSSLVFITIQTPHSPAFGGEVPVPEERRDFEYCYLIQGCRDLCQAALQQQKHITMVVVSTVLPGTINRLIRPLLNEYVALIYSPGFIAMGTTIADYRNPEFIICGVDKKENSKPLADVFAPLGLANRLFITSIETAELIKVAYNIYLSGKIVFASTLMEICAKTGADCDEVIDALSLATDRIISPKYLRGGMPDGGSCHPRDLIALSWLAERLDLSYDLSGSLVQAREAQTQWIADQAVHYKNLSGLPITILGKSYKPGSAITAGSPALLLEELLREENPWQYDPYVEEPHDRYTRLPCVFIIATAHPEFYVLKFMPRSIVIDPWGRMKDQPEVTVIRVGRKH